MYNLEDLTTYMKDVRKTTLLSRDEEISLARRIQNGDKDAEEKLVLANLRFVVSVARKYQNLGLPLADLINEGNYGLIKAAKLFNPEAENKFISYAVWWIKQSIIQSINDCSRMIRLPVNLSNELLKLRKVVQDDICHANMYPRVISLEDFSDSSCHTDAFDLIVNNHPQIVSEDDTIENEESLKDALQCAMCDLDCRENYIIAEYFLNEDETKTLEVIGCELNLTKERVRQIRDKALRKIRNNSDSLFSFLE